MVRRKFFILRIVKQQKVCSLHPWKISRHNWIKPWATRFELTAASVLALNKRLDKITHEDPSNVN